MSILTVVALLGGLVVWLAPWQDTRCGRGLTAVGDPYVCVGLDLDSSALQHNDPLADLETDIKNQNAKVASPYATIVLLENMTPDPTIDSASLNVLRHRIEGALTAAERADNGSGAAGGTAPGIKLLLANFGSQAGSWQRAVAAIEQAPKDARIAAVAGIGQSLDNTRAAVAQLSEHGITTVAESVTADDMNKDLQRNKIQDFFRVSATNTEQVLAAKEYLDGKHLPHQHIVLLHDPTDPYSATLYDAFIKQFPDPALDRHYIAPTTKGIARNSNMTGVFAQMHGDICTAKPDLIYFAGRGVDLNPLLKSLANDGSCGLGPITVLAGDDAINAVGVRLPTGGAMPGVTVLYTGLAHPAEWSAVPPDTDEVKNYADFKAAFDLRSDAFGKVSFPDGDLDDGMAIMMHDAVLVEATAIRRDGESPDGSTPSDPGVAADQPSTVANFVLGITCGTTVVPGASGFIAFDQDTQNPKDKAVPIILIQPNGNNMVQSISWPEGSRPNYAANAC